MTMGIRSKTALIALGMLIPWFFIGSVSLIFFESRVALKLLGSLLVGPGFFVSQTVSDALRDMFFWSASLSHSIQHSGDLLWLLCLSVTFFQIWALLLTFGLLRRRIANRVLTKRHRAR
jgi:hypothetical protein